MAELAVDCTRGDHVLEREPGGWLAGVQEERTGCAERSKRVRHLLFNHLNRHADSKQTMRDLQEYFPFSLSVPVV